MISPTRTRVQEYTDEEVNQKIQDHMQKRLMECAKSPEKIDQRLKEIEIEWDIERALETNGSILLLLGVTMGLIHRRWLLLPMLVGGFCLQHALQGWCPPVGIFRRLGIRTASEIEEERIALKALRGDFRGVLNRSREARVKKVLAAIRHDNGAHH
jgi:hypothetical protein